MNESKPKTEQAIQDALAAFASKPDAQAATDLLGVLGYRSARRISLVPNTADNFIATFDRDKSFRPDQALAADWQSVDFLFQLTDSEISSSEQGFLAFDSRGAYDGAIMESYLFFAISLAKERYTRTQLAAITRAINKLFDMPVMVIFRYGNAVTLAVIRRRLHKRNESKDVLDKVTLVKDINFVDPLRAHVEILYDLSLQVLYQEFYFHNFTGLHVAWEKRLDSYALNERFYREVADWYFWAQRYQGLVYPRDVRGEEQQSMFLIRLLTRLIFCWFLQEKGLIPRDLFRSRFVKGTLKDSASRSGTYYKAFLQNLFFATLNQEQNKRGFRRKYEGTRNGNRGVTNLYRHADLLVDPDGFMQLLSQVPFVNGGLFDCLDTIYDQKGRPNIRLDDFSEERGNTLCLPNELFFGVEREVDLTDVYQDKRHKKEHVRGLIEILSRYKFTVEENTPLEQEIALDPELLGKVFENLLASYNEDTRTTARKATGSFYTPREIVDYMVDEALATYLHDALKTTDGNGETSHAELRNFLKAAASDLANPFPEDQTEALVRAIDSVKILDPACGSGAFPMGVLHKMVSLLQRLDPNNRHWKERQLDKARADRLLAERMQDEENRRNAIDDVEARISDIEHSFDTRFHAIDFARKLYLIENCLYGVDIQPIACQIAKLRFFIALIVDQNVDNNAPNRGVRPLPNLETKIVAADTLVPIERKHVQGDMFAEDSAAVIKIEALRRELERVRHEYFGARTPSKKRKCREEDEVLRGQIAELLRQTGLDAPVARDLAAWDPYDQNAHAAFFDPEWMFGVPVGKILVRTSPGTAKGHLNLVNETVGQMEIAGQPTTVESGFDIVIGNPPYVRIQTLKQKNPDMAQFLREHYVSASKGNYDVYVVFVERGLQLLKRTGNLAYILPHKFFNAQYGEPLRGLIAKGKYLRHVVHFGDQQVFPGSSNYVCLMFLSKSGSESLRYDKAVDLPAWLQRKESIRAVLPSKSAAGVPWNFVVGAGTELFNRLNSMPLKLDDVAARIFQGIKTSADKVYIVEMKENNGRQATVYCQADGLRYIMESGLLHPLIKGGDSKRFRITTTNRFVIFPYGRSNDGDMHLISQAELRTNYPLTWLYLNTHKSFLENREDGKMCHDGWYGYVYPKALEVIQQPKIFTPDIAPEASFSFDALGTLFFSGGVAGGYGIIAKSPYTAEYLLAILNSLVCDYFHHKIATQMRGGWFSYEARFIKHLPIPQPSTLEQNIVTNLVRYILWINEAGGGQNDANQSPRDSLMLGYFEQLINGLVYELFFSEDLHRSALSLFRIVKEANLPGFHDIPEINRLKRVREVFESIYSLNHPIRGTLHALRSLETIRIIEGDV